MEEFALASHSISSKEFLLDGGSVEDPVEGIPGDRRYQPGDRCEASPGEVDGGVAGVEQQLGDPPPYGRGHDGALASQATRHEYLPQERMLAH